MTCELAAAENEMFPKPETKAVYFVKGGGREEGQKMATGKLMK